MSKQVVILASVAALAIGAGVYWFGFGGPNATSGAPGPAQIASGPELPSILIDVPWLKEHLASERLIVVDSRNVEDYRKDHIPGAISLPTDVTYDVEKKNKLPPVPKVEAILGGAGIDMDTTVVIYDQGSFRWAARIFWMLECHGHRRAAILNGGYAEWLEKKLSTSTSEEHRPPAVFVASVNASKVATKLTTRQAIDDSEVDIIDCRSGDEFSGHESKWPRNGHIPTAHNVEWLSNLAGDAAQDHMTFKPVEELKAMYDQRNVRGKCITYCTQGKRASVGYFALRLCGKDVAVYDGSWSEWTQDPDLPAVGPGS